MAASAGTYILSDQNLFLTLIAGFLTFNAVTCVGLCGDVARILGSIAVSVGCLFEVIAESTVNSFFAALPKPMQDAIATTTEAVTDGWVSTKRNVIENPSVQKITTSVIPLTHGRMYDLLQEWGDVIAAAALPVQEQISLASVFAVGNSAAAADAAGVTDREDEPVGVFQSGTDLSDTAANPRAYTPSLSDQFLPFQYRSAQKEAAVQSVEPPNIDPLPRDAHAAADTSPSNEVDLFKSFESVASLADTMQDGLSAFSSTIEENKSVSFNPPNTRYDTTEAHEAVISAVAKEQEVTSDDRTLNLLAIEAETSADAAEHTATRDTATKADDFDMTTVDSISDTFQLARGLDEPHSDIVRSREKRAALIEERHRRMLESSSADARADFNTDTATNVGDDESVDHYSNLSKFKPDDNVDFYPKACAVPKESADVVQMTTSLRGELVDENPATSTGIDLSAFDTAFDLAREVDDATIDSELTKLGLTNVGDNLEKARRLFLTKKLSRDQLPRSLFA